MTDMDLNFKISPHAVGSINIVFSYGKQLLSVYKGNYLLLCIKLFEQKRQNIESNGKIPSTLSRDKIFPNFLKGFIIINLLFSISLTYTKSKGIFISQNISEIRHMVVLSTYKLYIFQIIYLVCFLFLISKSPL